MNLEEKIKASETRIFKAVFPNTTNHYDTLFGGTAMLLMDEVAFITATRFTRKRCVTVSSDRIDFKKPIPAGTIIVNRHKFNRSNSQFFKMRNHGFRCKPRISPAQGCRNKRVQLRHAFDMHFINYGFMPGSF